MEHRAVGNRVSVDLDALKLSISNEEAINLLQRFGFVVLEVRLIELARACIGYSRYKRGARFGESPHIVDCSSFTKWLYAQKGYWLPRFAIQQRARGVYTRYSDTSSGDLVFVSGYIDRYEINPKDGVGHVGIATGEGSVIHAGGSKTGVIETALEEFAPPVLFRGVRRYVQDNSSNVTLGIPSKYDVETADDVKWIILQSFA